VTRGVAAFYVLLTSKLRYRKYHKSNNIHNWVADYRNYVWSKYCNDSIRVNCVTLYNTDGFILQWKSKCLFLSTFSCLVGNFN